MGQVTTVFQDAFTSGALSTLNPTAGSPGTLTSSRTAYEIAASKSATASTVASGVMTFGNFSTGSGYCEGQALFTASPVTLNTPGQYIEFYYTFTATTTLFNGNANDNEQVSLGLYNSGGVGPTNGTALWGGNLSSGLTTADIGCTKGWQGYNGQIAYSKATAQSSAIGTRPAQTIANNDNQGLCPVSGYASGVNIGQISGVVGQPALAVGSQYTLDLKIVYVNATTLAITNSLYVGAGIGGAVYSAGGFTARNAQTVTGANLLTSTFDGLCIGFRPTSSPTTGETLQINNVTVLLVTPIAPGITGLTNKTVVVGTSPTLSPTVTGVPTAGCQWYVSTDGGATSNALSYATSSSLTLTNVQYGQNGYIYSLVAANSLGTNASSMILSVIVPPGIAGLNDQAVSTNDTVTMSPTVSGVPAPALQWRFNGTNLTDGPTGNGSTISGSTSSPLVITAAALADGGTYSLVASNSAGMVTNSMNLIVSAGSVLPSITGPTNITVIQGNNGTFSALVFGLPLPTVQWLDQTGAPITAATNSTLTLSNVLYSQNGFVYSIVASNSVGTATNSATLTVIVPPAITSQPSGLVVTNTQSASFTVGATGVPAVAYQWSKNGSPISGATGATYSIGSVSSADTATYSVTITNQAGSTNSASVTLTVNSTMAPTAFTPSNGQTGVCYDTPLYITFSRTPTLRTAGKIRVYNVTNAVTPVDTIDLGLCTTANVTYAANIQAYNFNGDTITNFPVIITGLKAAIYPHHGLLTSNQTYYVTMDDGAFVDSTGAYFAGIAATNTWQFATKLTGPAISTNLVVAADGSGDFLTVQGAVDSLPANNTTPTIINIRNGTYTEEVDVKAKNNLDFRGQSRTGTFIGYPDNNWVNGNGAPWRSMFILNGNDCSFENLTITNTTPAGGSQAEAMDVEGTRAIFYNMELDSYQDTFLVHSAGKLVYFQNCLIQGQTDFNWGYGSVYYTNCEVRCLLSGGHVTQPRSPYTTNGFGFINCRITQGYSGASAFDLGRTIGTPTSPSEVLFYNCLMADVVTGYASDAGTNMADYACSNLTATTTKTLANSIHSTGSDAFVLAIQSASTWLYGWAPQLAPNILTNPVGQTVAYAAPAAFNVAATGIPAPTYQWIKDGTNLTGATSTTINIASAALSDGGSYSVVVTTPAGSVTSSPAVLTVTPPSNTAPVFTAPIFGTNFAINVGVNLAVACPATDSDLPAQTLTYSLLTGPPGAAVDSGTGNFTWRPGVSSAGSVNNISVVVTDNGTPNLSATNSFTVTVNSLSAPAAGTSAYAGGQFSVSVSGQVGPDYALQASTNLAGGGWTTVAVTNSPASVPFILTDTNAAAQPMQFYRIVTGPPLP